MTPTAQEGDAVKITYTGTLEDGTVFDSSEGREPLSFTIGAGQMIKGFEKGVLGMAQGEEKDLVIPPEEAYGEHRPELVQTIPKDRVGDLDVQEGMILGMQVPGHDQVFPATVTKVEADTITLDVNPPLAGKTLHFHIKLETVEKKTTETGETA